MKFSLSGRYWIKYASFVNIEYALLFIYENMQDKYAKYYGIVQNVEYDYLRFLYLGRNL